MLALGLLQALCSAFVWAADPASSQQLGKAFQEAHARRDKAALSALFHPEGLNAEQKALNEQLIASVLTLTVAAVEISPLKPGEADGYSLDGVGYRLNAEPAAVMELRPDKWGDGPPSMAFVVGKLKGVYKIASAAPVSGAAAPAPAPAVAGSPRPAPAKAPVAGKPAAAKPMAPAAAAFAVMPAAAPTKDPDALPRKVEYDCSGEIGMFCNELRENPKGLLGCLKENADSARKACKAALEAL